MEESVGELVAGGGDDGPFNLISGKADGEELGGALAAALGAEPPFRLISVGTGVVPESVEDAVAVAVLVATVLLLLLPL